MPVVFHSNQKSFKLKNKTLIRRWISSEVQLASFKCGSINIIFCSDEYLLEINRKYLNHDFFTDIITFNYNSKFRISGDLFISIERVLENAKLFKTEFDTELKRVMIHGVLHLLGYEDSLPKQKEEIRKKEDEALMRFPL